MWLLQIKQFYLVPSACISAGRESPRRELSTGELLLSSAGPRGGWEQASRVSCMQGMWKALCSVMDVDVGSWEGRLLRHQTSVRGWVSAQHSEAQSTQPGGGGGESWWSALLRVSTVRERAGSWTPITCPCLSLSPPGHFSPRSWTDTAGHKLPGPALSSLALFPSSPRPEE